MMASFHFLARLVLMVSLVSHVLEASYVSVTPSPPSCATIDCLPDQTCKMYNGVPKCVKIPGSDCNMACTLEFNPVCGSDGKTYSNKCAMNVAACKAGKVITVASSGACPVGCEAVSCVLPKVCKEINGRGTCVCRTACPKILRPVCGSDGVTYSNECLLQVEACKTDKTITVVSQGHCPIGCALILCASPKICVENNGVGSCVCPTICPAVFQPVCGSDGKTYSNRCHLNAAACSSNKVITVVSDGPCPIGCEAVSCLLPKVCEEINGRGTCVCRTACPKILRPVCGSDGVTYSNECLLQVEACKTGSTITVVSQGRCPIGCALILCASPKICVENNGVGSCVCPTICPAVFQPVCGSDGKTYSNRCHLNAAACSSNKVITVVSDGPCPKPTTAPTPPAPSCDPVICANPNVCKLVNGQSMCICSKFCTLEFAPVCGSDGKTYSNKCELRVSACSRNQRIRIVSEGPCPPKITCANVRCKANTRCKMINGKPVCLSCPEGCPEIYKPVCGSNKVTYDNECEMERAGCKKGIIIKVLYNRPCGRVCFNFKCHFPPYSTCENVNSRPKCVCKFLCIKKRHPICGSDGKMYTNLCIMKRTACETKKKITAAPKKLCNPCLLSKPCTSPPYSSCRVVDGKAKCVCRKGCPRIYAPVCGSDGMTYSNACALKASACRRNKKIHVKRLGKCINPCKSRTCPNYAKCEVKYGKAVCVCPEVCTKIYRPVCGTDGQTYSNECVIKVASCKKGEKIKIAYEGKCRVEPDNAY